MQYNILKISLLHNIILICIISAICLSCKDNDEVSENTPTPQDVTLSIVAAKANGNVSTRVTDGVPKNPDAEVELIHKYWIAVADNAGKVVKLVSSGAVAPAEIHTYSEKFQLTPGTYRLYGFANIEDSEFQALGITEGSQMPDLTNKTIQRPNNYKGNIPMTSRLDGQTIRVTEGDDQNFSVEVIRTMAKLEFTFFNSAKEEMMVNSINIEPISNSPVFLMPRLDNNEKILFSLPASTTTERVKDTLTTSPIVIAKGATSGSHYIYVNESDNKAANVTESYALRVYAKRSWDIDTEQRYNLILNTDMNELRRNDWVKIPVDLGSYEYYLRVLFYPPIGGLPATVSRAETDDFVTTFLAGGPFVIQPFIRETGTTEWIQIFRTSIVEEYTIQLGEEGREIYALAPEMHESGEIIGELKSDGTTGTNYVIISIKVKLSETLSRVLRFRVFIVKK